MQQFTKPSYLQEIGVDVSLHVIEAKEGIVLVDNNGEDVWHWNTRRAAQHIKNSLLEDEGQTICIPYKKYGSKIN